MDDNGDWRLDVDLKEIIGQAKLVRLDGEQVHGDILHRLFCEVTDEELQALAMDFWTLARAFGQNWKYLDRSWYERLGYDAAWKELDGKVGEVRALLESLYGAPLQELDRRMEARIAVKAGSDPSS